MIVLWVLGTLRSALRHSNLLGAVTWTLLSFRIHHTAYV